MKSLQQTHIMVWRRKSIELMRENQVYLTHLDTATRDRDHGTNLERGFRKLEEKIGAIRGRDIGITLKNIGMLLLKALLIVVEESRHNCKEESRSMPGSS